MNAREILLIYDRDCPACDTYCRLVRLPEAAGRLRLIDARKSSAAMEEISHRGLDIDQGMVLKLDGTLYYGADAIHALSRVSGTSGLFNRINYWMFGSEARARALYPLLRLCRNQLLKLLRRTKINNLRLPGNDRF